MKRFLLVAALFATTTFSQATTVTYSSDATQRKVRDFSGALLRPLNNYSIAIGTFTLNQTAGVYTGGVTWDDNQSAQTNIAALQSSGGWSQFSTIKVNTGLNAANFGLVGSYIDDTATATPFNGKQIYVWIYNNANSALATEVGVFTDGAPWVFPANAGGATDLLTLSTPTSTAYTALNGFGVNPGTTGPNFQLIAPVPEPSTFALLGVSAIAGLARRRRSRKA